MDESKKKPAVFLDRDGTIIEDRGHIKDPRDLSIFPFSIPALAKLQERFSLFIVTNQSGVAAGLITADEVRLVNEALARELRSRGIGIEETYVCPHAKEDGCACRKPGDLFLREAEKTHRIDLSRSYSVGDHAGDFSLCENAGGKGAYVLTGHGEKHREDCPRIDRIFNDLGEAADWIIADSSNLSEDGEISAAARALRSGALVVFPTETVYGLGADATNERAVSGIFALKERPDYDPLIVHIHDLGQLPLVCSRVDEKARLLIEAFWPGPLTLVLEKSPRIPEVVTSGLPTVGVRFPSHPIARVFLEKCGVPVAAPSANKFGYVSPTEAGHARALADGVAAILDGGRSRLGIESTIISFEETIPAILRKGAVTKRMIEAVIGPVRERTASTSRPRAPGMLASHYSPEAKVLLDPEAPPEGDGIHLFLSFGNNCPDPRYREFPLSRAADLEEAASNLYRGLRYADEIGAASVSCFLFDEEGLGGALNDKLRRAAAG